MASTFSPLLRIELIGAGEQSGAWNNTTNTNLGTLLEQAIAGSTSVSLAGTATYNLGGDQAIANGASDIQRNIAISFTDNPGADAVITVPSTSKIYFIRNATGGGWALKLKTSSQLLADAIVVPNGRTMIVGCDGTNAVQGINSLPALSTIGSDVIATVSGTETLTNKTLTAPKFADNGFISDPSANPLLAFDTLASGLLAAGSGSLSVSNGPSLLVTTGASGTGTTATVTYTAANSTQIPVGASVTIAGVSPSGYNGTYAVTASSAGSISYANTTTATYSSSGTVSVEPAIAALGVNSNVGINLVPKGTGVVQAAGVEVATISGTQALSNKTIVSPANVSATTGNAAIIAATGVDTDINISVTPKGAGKFLVSGNTGLGTASPDALISVNGVASFGAGAVATPSVAAFGDLNTGMWFPAADTIAFSTNGTEDLRLGSAGQIGIAGANYGTTGQVLTSGGASAAPSWETPSPITLGTAVTASGTSVGFTGIPSTANRITISFANLSSTGTLLGQIGTSSGYITTGYSSGSSTDGGSSGSTSGFVARNNGGGGAFTFTKINDTNWSCTNSTGDSSGGGYVIFTGTLDRVRLTASSFTSGTVNVMYE